MIGQRRDSRLLFYLQGRGDTLTRPAPGIGTNLGGSMEVVVQPGGVQIEWFHMP